MTFAPFTGFDPCDGYDSRVGLSRSNPLREFRHNHNDLVTRECGNQPSGKMVSASVTTNQVVNGEAKDA